MSANWGMFISQVSVGSQPTSEEQTAMHYADLYMAAIATATQSIYKNTIIPITVNKQSIVTGLVTAFKTIKALGPTPPTPAQFLPAAGGFIAAWSGAQFSPLPAHIPATVHTTGLTLLFPGEPSTLAAGLLGAFTAGNKQLHATILAGILKIHLLTISGVYNGLMPNPGALIPPMIATPPIPWVGII